jgi:hypothetical protein
LKKSQKYILNIAHHLIEMMSWIENANDFLLEQKREKPTCDEREWKKGRKEEK